MATSEKPPAKTPSESPFLQFGLRTMLLAMAGVCALLALGARFGGYAALTLLLFIALAIAHVVGNAIGTSQRDRASRSTDPEKPTPPPPTTAMLRPPGTLLRGDLPLTRRSMVGT